MRTALTAVVVALLLAGCGGGGGDGGGSITPAQPGGATYSASLPGADLTVQRTAGSGAAGSTSTWRITTTATNVAALAVYVGPDWDTLTAVAVTAAGPGAWDATLTLPNPLPSGCAVLVRVTFADGNLVETCAGAIPL